MDKEELQQLCNKANAVRREYDVLIIKLTNAGKTIQEAMATPEAQALDEQVDAARGAAVNAKAEFYNVSTREIE